MLKGSKDTYISRMQGGGGTLELHNKGVTHYVILYTFYCSNIYIIHTYLQHYVIYALCMHVQHTVIYSVYIQHYMLTPYYHVARYSHVLLL